MNDLEKIVAQHINYALDITSALDVSIKDKKLTDYQLFTARVFVGLKSMSSLLVFWDTGLGKTLLGLYVIKNITFTYPSWKIFLFVRASLHNIWEEGIKYYCNKKVEILHYDDINVFMKFKNKLENYRTKKDRILILIDEVHNVILRNKERNYDSKERKIRRLFNLIRNITSEGYNKLLLMTATPIVNDITEFHLLVDIMRKGILKFDERYFKNEKLVNKNALKKSLVSLCSYKTADANSLENTEENDNFASKRVFIHRVVMSEYQESLYNDAERYELKNIDLYSLKPIRRMVSTFVFHDLKIRENMDDDEFNMMVKERLESFRTMIRKIHVTDEIREMLINEREQDITDKDFVSLNNFSCKYIQTCKYILKSRGKCLIYEPFVSFEGLATLKEYLNIFGITYIEYSKFTSSRQSNLKMFNDNKNNDGNVIKCCLITNAGSEGVSFTCINDMIILDIPWSESQLRQIIGRSLRYNSHINTDRKYVNIHIILAFTKAGKSSDQEMLNIVKKKLNRIKQIYSVLKETSIENINFKYKTMEPIEEEYIYETIQKNIADFENESDVVDTKELTRIKFLSCSGFIEEGFLDYASETVYNDSMDPVGKIRIINGVYDIFVRDGIIVYNIDVL